MEVLIFMGSFVPPEGITTRELAAAKSLAAGELLTRAMEHLGLLPWEPKKDSRGKPLPHDGWHVSKSHCAKALAVAIGPVPLGIDVEPIRLARVASWERVVDEHEREWIGDVDALAFTRLWTAKEAALKVSGQGIADLSKCRLMAPFEPDCLRLRHGDLPRLVQQRITKDHIISVCSPGVERITWMGSPTAG